MKLDTLQRKADYWAAKLGVGPVRVDWLERCPSPSFRRHLDKTNRIVTKTAILQVDSGRLHAHCHTDGQTRGTICVAAHVETWRGSHVVSAVSRLMRHEVAHLVGKGNHGTKEFMAAAGEQPRKRPYYPPMLPPVRMSDGRFLYSFVPGLLGQEIGKAGIREVVEIRRTA